MSLASEPRALSLNRPPPYFYHQADASVQFRKRCSNLVVNVCVCVFRSKYDRRSFVFAAARMDIITSSP